MEPFAPAVNLNAKPVHVAPMHQPIDPSPCEPADAPTPEPASVQETPGRRRSPDWTTPFLKNLAACGTISEAAKASGVNRKTVQRWCRDDPEFATDVRMAKDDAVDGILSAMRPRLIHGCERRVLYKGQPVWHWVDEHGKDIPTPPAKKKRGAEARGCRRAPLMDRRYHDGVALALLKCLRYDAQQARRAAKAKAGAVPGNVNVTNSNTNVNALTPEGLFEQLKEYQPVFDKLERERKLALESEQATREGDLAEPEEGTEGSEAP
jgi:hypothetical protein